MSYILERVGKTYIQYAAPEVLSWSFGFRGRVVCWASVEAEAKNAGPQIIGEPSQWLSAILCANVALLPSELRCIGAETDQVTVFNPDAARQFEPLR